VDALLCACFDVQVVSEYAAIMGDRMGEVIGETYTDLDGRFTTVRHQESNLCNLLCDVYRRACSADVAILNSGTFRFICDSSSRDTHFNTTLFTFFCIVLCLLYLDHPCAGSISQPPAHLNTLLWWCMHGASQSWLAEDSGQPTDMSADHVKQTVELILTPDRSADQSNKLPNQVVTGN